LITSVSSPTPSFLTREMFHPLQIIPEKIRIFSVSKLASHARRKHYPYLKL
jgi:hypothetical protein